MVSLDNTLVADILVNTKVRGVIFAFTLLMKIES